MLKLDLTRHFIHDKRSEPWVRAAVR